MGVWVCVGVVLVCKGKVCFIYSLSLFKFVYTTRGITFPSLMMTTVTLMTAYYENKPHQYNICILSSLVAARGHFVPAKFPLHALTMLCVLAMC